MQNDIVRQQPKSTEESNPEPSPETVEPVVSAAAEPEPAKASEPTPQLVPEKTKSTKPVGIISAAIVLCLVFVGTAIYTGSQSTTPEVAKTPSVQPESTAPALDTTQQIDSFVTDTATLDNNAGQDLSADLSDASLGL